MFPLVWTGVHRGFAVRAYYENDRSMIAPHKGLFVKIIFNTEEMTEEHDLGDIWFQQDGATAHTAQNSLVVLQQTFPMRLVSNNGDEGWPARSYIVQYSLL